MPGCTHCFGLFLYLQKKMMQLPMYGFKIENKIYRTISGGDTTTVTRKTARRTKKKRSLPQQIPQRLNPKKLTKTKKITQKHLKNTRT